MSKLSSLRATSTLTDLANLINCRPSALSYILFKMPAKVKYQTFNIPKRNGGIRTIQAPTERLKLIQQKISELLQDCVDEIRLARNLDDRIAHGFVRGRSIITNARMHRNRRYLFNVDLKDFFPSINFGRVRGYFIRDRNFALNRDVATVIAQIACHENALPQGSPCSPVISNLIAHVLDVHLVRLASKVGCVYSRYADDLTFSTNKKIFPAAIAIRSKTETDAWEPAPELLRLVTHSGFQINSDKTHMQYRHSRQQVTGLIVNNKIGIRHEYRHTVRAMVYSLLSKGSFTLHSGVDTTGEVVASSVQGTPKQLHGMLGFIDRVDDENRSQSKGAFEDRKTSARERLYRQFLLYKNFFAANAPVILCEGATDNVYLTHAIRSLVSDYPELGTLSHPGTISLNVQFYKYRRSSAARTLGLHDGGSSALAKFIATYHRESKTFRGTTPTHPIIIVYDNDSGAGGIRNSVRAVTGKKLQGDEAYAHVSQNLYVVATPLLDGTKESKIEDFFETHLKKTLVSGKTFSDKNDFDSTKHYGKAVFAHRVVRPLASAVNFDGFRPLLSNLVSAIRSYAERVSSASSE